MRDNCLLTLYARRGDFPGTDCFASLSLLTTTAAPTNQEPVVWQTCTDTCRQPSPHVFPGHCTPRSGQLDCKAGESALSPLPAKPLFRRLSSAGIRSVFTRWAFIACGSSTRSSNEVTALRTTAYVSPTGALPWLQCDRREHSVYVP